jgi:hypothetical protein
VKIKYFNKSTIILGHVKLIIWFSDTDFQKNDEGGRIFNFCIYMYIGPIFRFHFKCKTVKSPTPEGVGDFPVLHFLPVFDFISHFYQLFLVSCLFVNSTSCKQCDLFPLHVGNLQHPRVSEISLSCTFAGVRFYMSHIWFPLNYLNSLKKITGICTQDQEQ